MIGLLSGDFAALGRIERGGIYVTTFNGVAPSPVTLVREGDPSAGLAGAPISAPGFRRLRSTGLVEWPQGDGYGPWPLSLTDKGRAALTTYRSGTTG